MTTCPTPLLRHRATPEVAARGPVFAVEYGKPCREPGGPIEPRTDHAQLASSPGFPESLRKLCAPAFLGVFRPEVEALPHGFGHGTVYRAVRADGLWYLVAWRLTQQPEDGPSGRARRYTLGRYVATAGGHGPRALVAALAGAPARLTYDGARQAVAGISEAPSPEDAPAIPAAFEAAFESVLAYIASGVGVSLLGDVAEDVFFQLADALWRLVPDELRPLFSAGWGVASSVAIGLSLSCGSPLQPNQVGLDVDSGNWIVPEGREGQLTGPLASRLRFGRAFALETTRRAPEPLDHALFAGAPSLPDGPLCLSDSPEVGALWRWGGRRIIDRRRTRALVSWVAGEGGDGPLPELPRFTDQVRAAERAVLTTRPEPGRPTRVDAALAALCEVDIDGMLTLAADESLPLTSRAALWLAATRCSGVLAALATACEEDTAEPLPAVLATQVAKNLDAGLAASSDEQLRQLRALLDATRLPAVVEQWLRANDLELVQRLALGELGHGLGPLLGRHITPSTPAEAFLRCLAAEPPAPRDVAPLGTGSPDTLARWKTWLDRQWRRSDGDVATRRQTVLAWLDVLPFTLRDPLIQASERGAELSGASLEAVADALRTGAVPARLLEPLSLALARGWYRAHTVVRRDLPVWHSLLMRWPADARTLALGDAEGEVETSAVVSALKTLPLVMAASDLDERVMWLLEHASVGEGGSPLSWAFRQVGVAVGRAPLTSVARWVRGHAVAELAPSPATLRLLRSWLEVLVDADAPLQLAPTLAGRVNATWQLRLLLELWPDRDVRPTSRMLELAARDRRWLMTHLEADGVHPGRRRHFACALWSFHALDLDSPESNALPAGLRQSALWGLFDDVPIEEQGDLDETLACFATAPPRKLELCLRYLAATDRRDTATAALKVASEVIRPQLERALGTGDAMALLETFATAARWSLVPTRRRDVQRARASILRHPLEEPIACPTPEGFSVSPALHALLARVHQLGPRDLWTQVLAMDTARGPLT